MVYGLTKGKSYYITEITRSSSEKMQLFFYDFVLEINNKEFNDHNSNAPL